MTRNNLFRLLVYSSIFAGLPLSQASPPAVTSVVLGKGDSYEQTSAAPPTTAVSHRFQVSINGGNLDAITPPTVVVPGGTQAGTVTLSDHSSDEWQFKNTHFVDLNAVNSAYGSGTYTTTVNGTTYSTLGFPSGVFSPNIPAASTNIGTWSGSVLLVDPSQSLTITSNVFSTNFVADRSRIALQMYGISGSEIEDDFTSSANHLSIDIPAFSLTSGQSYDVNVTFYTFVNPTTVNSTGFVLPDTTTLLGAEAVAAFVTDTHFTITAIPEPATGAAMIGGIGLIAGAWHRRRRGIRR